MFPASTKGGGTSLGFPDVCVTPAPPAGPIPIPYANQIDGFAASGNKDGQAAQKKMIDDAAKKGYKAKSATAVAIASQGDDTGSMRGIISAKPVRRPVYRRGPRVVLSQGKTTVLMEGSGNG